jgi:hypothetical protein
MSYEIVVTYTKTAESPADVFTTLPVLKSVATQQQIDTLLAKYPVAWDTKIILDQMIIHNVFTSEEEHAARNADPIVVSLQAQRKAWAEANKLTYDIRVL